MQVIFWRAAFFSMNGMKWTECRQNPTVAFIWSFKVCPAEGGGFSRSVSGGG